MNRHAVCLAPNPEGVVMKMVLPLLITLLLPSLGVLFAGQEAPTANKKCFDIRTFGAIPDGKTLNTVAIQEAIDACHAAGGGRVVVAGGMFLTGAVQLKSRITLVVEAGATLLGSPDIRDYGVVTVPIDWGWTYKKTAIAFAPCLIYAEKVERVGLEGKGTVDGQGGRQRKVFPNRGDVDARRPILVRFHECHDVTLRDVTLVDPAAYATFFVHCRDIAVEGVTIRSRQTVNGDGLDFDGCRNVRIAGCDMDCGDDAISPKTSHPDWPIEDFTITGCQMKSEWAAIRLGAESVAAMRRLDLRDCLFTDCRDGIKIESSEGALFEDLSFSKIEMRDVNRPIYVTATRFNFSAHSRSARPPSGRIHHLRLSDIRAVARAGDSSKPFDRTCAAIVALPGYAIEDVSFSNVQLAFPGGGTAEQAARLDVAEMLHFHDYRQWAQPFDGELPSAVLYLRHLRGVRLDNVRLTVEKPDARPFIAGDDVDGLTLHGVVGRSPGFAPGLVKVADARQATVRDCRVEGAETAPALLVPTAEDQRRLVELRQQAAAVDKAIQATTDAFDTAEQAVPLMALPTDWDFRADPRNEGEAARWFAAGPGPEWTKRHIEVSPAKPAESSAGAGWFAVAFQTPAFEANRPVYLRLGAVRGTCRVWLDGKLAGERTLPPEYVKKFPLTLDVTGLVRPSATHRLVVQVAGMTADTGLAPPFEVLVMK